MEVQLTDGSYYTRIFDDEGEEIIDRALENKFMTYSRNLEYSSLQKKIRKCVHYYTNDLLRFTISMMIYNTTAYYTHYINSTRQQLVRLWSRLIKIVSYNTLKSVYNFLFEI